MNSSNGNDPKSNHDELIQAYLDGDTSPEQEEQIRLLFQDPSFSERLASYALDSACLHELGQQGVLGQSAESRHSSEECEADLKAHDAPLVRWVAVSSPIVVTTVSLLLLLAALPFWLNRNSDETPVVEKPVIGRIDEAVSAVIVRQGGHAHPAAKDTMLRSGDILQSVGPEGSATFVFRDGTTLVFVGDAKTFLTEENGHKKVRMRYGDVDADVAPQPDGKPMLFVTSLAVARVMGTQLSISAETSATTLNVTEGLVVMERSSDGRSVDVRGGFQAVASPRSRLTVRQAPSVPDAWSADFEEGLPDDWRIGQWVADGVPGNSNGAVRSARWTTQWSSQSRLYFAVRSNRVIAGLFNVNDDTYLNFTYKMEQPGWFDLFVVVRHNDGSRRQSGNYAHKEKAWWRIPSGEWRTVSVPLTTFHKVIRGRPKDAPGIYPQTGDTVSSITFSTPKHDRGLTIDRVWVSRGKPAEVRNN